MSVRGERLGRVETVLYAFLAVAGTALASSAFLLWARGVAPALAVAAGFPPSLLLGCIGVASRFLCRALPLRRTKRSSLAAAQVGSAIAASGLWVMAWSSWVAVLNRQVGTRLTLDGSLLFGLGVLLVLATAAVHYLVIEVEASREAEEAALRYRILAREAELKAFKAQVDPHFLFNSLNAVASLCGSRPADAREMAQRLADFFRLVLRLGALERITLGEEIDLVTRYLAIEKVRFGDRLGFVVDVQDAARDVRLPPLLLQPLVENSVRHGIASVVEGGTVTVAGRLDDGILRIAIENPADPDRTDVRGEGIGLQNARARLDAVSDGRAMLRASEAGGRYRVEIEVPQ